LEFVHLHNHSDYSLLDGAARIPKYVEMAQEMGMKHLGLTDHGNLFGALRFEQACHQGGINPVVGCEVYVSPSSRQEKQTSGYKNFHMVLYCKNEEGYRNLMILVSKGYIEGFYYKPRIDDDLLRAHHEGLICSTACLGGEIPRYLVAGDYEKARDKAIEYNELFGEGNFYLEIMDHGIPEEKIVIEGIKKIHAETGIPIIATNDIHYLKKEHARAQDILVCIGTGKKMDDEKRFKMDKTEMYFKTAEQMHELFGDIPGALENTVRLAEKCDLVIPQPGPILPEYVIPENFETQAEYLKYLTWEGIKERYNEVTDKIKERVEYELKILLGMGFEGYFLIVWDFIHWARVNDIPVGPGRGSGAGSIIAYAMKITDIDPLKYELLFERFLNPERVSMPDFDIDFCFERRGEVIEYVNRKYGHDQVGGICTFGTLKTKAVLKDVARVLDIPFAESNTITKLIPEGKAPDGRKINTAVALEIEPKLKEFYDRGGAYTELFDTAKVLEGMNRHISTHACGKVIGNSILTDYVPLYKDQKTGEITTEFTMDIIEPCGLVKMDFLGLKTLTLLKNVETLVRKIDPEFDVNTVSEENKPTFDMLSDGKSTAVFQFESSGMQDILKRAKPNNIEDLIALNALYRPGPMQFIPQFIEGKKNPRTITFPDPSLEELLTPTYGVIVYQEQVMKVAQIIGGFSLGKADILRRAMGKKKVKDMAKMKVEFIAGAKEIGHAEKHASGIFDMLEPFAGYGFNKSHAAAYSVVAYKTAYCKANHPAEFWAANLTNEINDTTKMTEYMESARDEGIEILPPDINYSEKNFNVVDNKVFYGLIGIKGMGSAAVDVMIAEREANGLFESFMDFLERIDLRSVNKKVLEVGIQSGLFDKIESANRATLLHNMEKMLDHVNSIKEQSQFGQVSLFGDNQDEITPELLLEEVPAWENKEILQIEKDNLGFFFSGHPLDEYRSFWNKCTNLKLDKAFRASSEKDYTIMGMIKGVRSIMTKKGSKMAFATVEDFNGSIDLVLFSKTFEKYAHLLEDDKVLGFTGQIDLSRSEPSFKVKEIFVPEEMREIQSSEIHIELEERDFLKDELIDFRSFLQDRGGSSSVYLHLKRPSKKFVVKISGQISISPNPAILKEIGQYPIVSNVWKE
jgi:DNA polymerase III subunit alpha